MDSSRSIITAGYREVNGTGYVASMENFSLVQPEAWYNDISQQGVKPIAVVISLWHLLASLIMLVCLLASSSVRGSRTLLITMHLVLLYATSGLLVKLPSVYRNKMVNPFTWKADEGFCRLHCVAIQFVISVLPFVILSAVTDTLIWMRDPAYYRAKLTSLPARLAAFVAPWLVSVAVTVGVVMYAMPKGGRLVSGRCIPEFDSSRAVPFIIAILLVRLFIPLVAIVVLTALLVRATYRGLRRLPTVNSGVERFRLSHACVSTTALCVLYVLMVDPHYFQLVFLRIPGVANGKNYHQIAQAGAVILSFHEAFWNILPFIWVAMQFDAMLWLRRKCWCFRPLEEKRLGDCAEIEMLTEPDKGEEAEEI